MAINRTFGDYLIVLFLFFRAIIVPTDPVVYACTIIGEQIYTCTRDPLCLKNWVVEPFLLRQSVRQVIL